MGHVTFNGVDTLISQLVAKSRKKSAKGDIFSAPFHNAFFILLFALFEGNWTEELSDGPVCLLGS